MVLDLIRIFQIILIDSTDYSNRFHKTGLNFRRSMSEPLPLRLWPNSADDKLVIFFLLFFFFSIIIFFSRK